MSAGPASESVVAVDGGNSKTDVVVASLAGELLGRAIGPGSNLHGLGVDKALELIGRILARIRPPGELAAGVYYLCGADTDEDLRALRDALAARDWSQRVRVENDVFAVLRAGATGSAAGTAAVVCGAGLNVVGRRADGATVRYRGYGWESGDWGGAEALGREALFHACRAEDGRGEPTALVEAVRETFGVASAAALGDEVHHRRIPATRLGDLAPAVSAAAASGDAVAGALLDRLAREVASMAALALRDLGLEPAGAEVVLGGGMLAGGRSPLVSRCRTQIERECPGATALVLSDPPVLGAALDALDDAGAAPSAGRHLREMLATTRVETSR